MQLRACHGVDRYLKIVVFCLLCHFKAPASKPHCLSSNKHQSVHYLELTKPACVMEEEDNANPREERELPLCPALKRSHAAGGQSTRNTG